MVRNQGKKQKKRKTNEEILMLSNLLMINIRVVGSPPATFFLYSSGLWRFMAAASPFNGSMGLGYVSSCGRKLSKMLDRSGNGTEQVISYNY